MGQNDDRVSILEADAYHIGMELYDMEFYRDSMPEDFNLDEAKFRIEAQEIAPPLFRMNLHRISDGIAIRYHELPAFEAVIKFLEEFYDQAMDKGPQYMAAMAAETLCGMYLDDCYWGHALDDTDKDGYLKRSEPTMSEETLWLAAEWRIWTILAEYEYAFEPEDLRDYVAERFSARSGHDAKEWRELLIEVAHEVGPDTESKVRQHISRTIERMNEGEGERA